MIIKLKTIILVGLGLFFLVAFPAQAQGPTYISGSISVDTTWTLVDSPYVIQGTVAVLEGVTLTVEPGVVVKFESQSSTLRVLGTLNSQGTESQPVYFTSIKDDSVGGDTNNDGSATAPTPSDWSFIDIPDPGTANLNHSIIRFGGRYGYAGIVVSGGALSLVNSRLTQNGFNGVGNLLVKGGTADIVSSEFDHSEYGIRQEGGTVNVSQSSIHDNANYGAYSSGASIMNAQNNFWGDPSGPYHPTLNPDGLGDRVSDRVDFEPWLGYDPTKVRIIDVAVILAEPSDVPHENLTPSGKPCKLDQFQSETYPEYNKKYYEDLVYCVADYHKENSFETINLNFTIYDNDEQWFRTNRNEEDYLADEREFVIDAIASATNAGIDLSDKDIVIVLHSGEAVKKQAHIGKRLLTSTWPPLHQPSDYPPYKIIIAEDDMVGAWAHEIGHIIGALLTPENTIIPDLSKMGLKNTWPKILDFIKAGSWDLMGEGSWNNGGNNPPYMSSYTKEFLQWLNYDIYPKSSYSDDYWINSLETSQFGDKVFRYNLSNDTNDESPKYYILEARNRNLKTWDSSLPGLPVIEDKNLVLYYVDTKGLDEYDYVPEDVTDYQEGMMWNQYRIVTIPASGSNDGILNPLFNETYRDFDELVKFTAVTDRTIGDRYEMRAKIEEIKANSFLDRFWGVILRPKSFLEQRIKIAPIIFNPLNISESYNSEVYLAESIEMPLKGPATASELVAGIGRFVFWLLLTPLILLGLLLLFLDKIIISRLKSERGKKVIKIVLKIVWILALISFVAFIVCLVLVPILEKIEPPPPSSCPPGIICLTPLLYVASPDLDLHLYCDDSRHIGTNYETGEYENQIPDSIVSGDNQDIPEWIFIPASVTGCHFAVSSYDNQKFLEENPEIAQEIEDTTDAYDVYARYVDPETDIYTSTFISEDIKPGAELEHQITGTHDIAIGPGTLIAKVDFNPDTLNLKSKGKWVTAYIELPENYDANLIDLNTILLNDQVSAINDPKYDFVTDPNSYLVDSNDNGILERMVKFDQSAVQNILEVGNEVEVTITGELTDGSSVQGSDTIKVISKGKKVAVLTSPALLASMGAASLFVHRRRRKFLTNFKNK